MKRILFRPFNAGTWFSFGFVFFLQSCMEGSGGPSNFRLPSTGGSSGRGSGHDGDTGNSILGAARDLFGHLSPATLAKDPLVGDTSIIAIAVVIGLVVAVPLVVLIYWLGTRGQMMAIRSVAMGQANISEQWNATRDAASRLFKFQLVMGVIGLVVLLPLIGGGAFLALPTINEGVPIENVLPALIGIGVVLVLAMIPLMLVNAMSRNFVAPIMLKHGVSAREGWQRFWAIGKGHIGGIVVFYLMRMLVSVGAAIVGLIAGVFTCCLGFLPILHQTVMAPYYVFERGWTLEVLASMSPDFDVRSSAGPMGPPNMPYVYGAATPGANPYAPQPNDNPYAPPGYGGGGVGGFGGPPPGGFGAP